MKDKCYDDVPSITTTVPPVLEYLLDSTATETDYDPVFAHSGHATDCAYTTTIYYRSLTETGRTDWMTLAAFGALVPDFYT